MRGCIIMVESLRQHWRMYLGLILILLGGLYQISVQSSKNMTLNRIDQLTGEVGELEYTLGQKVKTKEDLEPEAEKIVESGVSVKDMGAEMIQIQQTLADAYMSDEGLSRYTDAEIEVIREAEKGYTRLTGVTNYVDLWLFNAEWDLRLESVGSYVDAEKIPIVFSIYTADGELAGLVRGIYNNEADFIDDIVRDYTEVGMTDRTDVGGR